MRWIVLAMLLGVSAISGGCYTLNQQSISHDFGGLRDTMGRTRTVCMLLVHGVGGYSIGDPDALFDAMRRELKLTPQGKMRSTPVPDNMLNAKGHVDRQDFVDPAGRVVRTYTLYWEPLADPIKKQYLGYDDAPEATDARLPIHNAIKQDLMNENVPDVILYAGDFKPVMQSAVRSALRRMQRDLNGDKDYEFFFISFSLGSRIIFDVVDQMDKEAEPTNGDAIVDKTASFFMLANQLSMLGLATVKPATQPVARPFPGYENMMQFVNRRHARATTGPSNQAAGGGLSIVAVSDPNDVFSYTIPPYVLNQSPQTYINVRLHVATTAYWIPTEGYVVSPIQAHAGYGHDPDVIKLIIDGAKATP